MSKTKSKTKTYKKLLWLDYDEIFSMGTSSFPADIPIDFERFPVTGNIDGSAFTRYDCPAGKEIVRTVLDAIKRSIPIESALIEPEYPSDEWTCKQNRAGRDLEKFLNETCGSLPIRLGVYFSSISSEIDVNGFSNIKNGKIYYIDGSAFTRNLANSLQKMDFAVQLISLLHPTETEAVLRARPGVAQSHLTPLERRERNIVIDPLMDDLEFKFIEICNQIDSRIIEWINPQAAPCKSCKRHFRGTKSITGEMRQRFYLYRYAIWRHLIAKNRNIDLLDKIKAAKIEKAEEEAREMNNKEDRKNGKIYYTERFGHVQWHLD